jgi:glycine C-acetyltransferase
MRDIQDRLDELKELGLYRRTRQVSGPQGPRVVLDGKPVMLLCSNNYLGLADHPRVRQAAADAAMRWGVGAGASRLISGNMTIHRRLEKRLADFERREACVLFGSGYLANTGIVAALAREGEVVFSDALNHASIVDGCRLARAETFVYDHADVEHLAWGLEQAAGRGALIVTDGVFSMDGYLAPLDDICDLADELGAMVLVDDSHAVGFVGEGGRGTPERFGVMDRVDILTGTLGKALGGASGGYVAAHQEVVDLLRQRSRPYLFSNAVAPAVAAGSLKALEIAATSHRARQTLRDNTALFRQLMTEAGFDLLPGEHPITPVMFPGEDGARQAAQVADAMLEEGVYVIAFSFPVVPQGKARIRVQLSAGHSEEDIRACVAAFQAARETVG